MPELTRTIADLSHGADPVGPAEYERVIARVREAVARAIPPGSIVLVVSRGDEELVRFPDHRGWHFPRTAGGEYAGHHPRDGEDAIGRIEELESAGASHIVFPRTAFWWFEHYPELAEYLTSRARLLVDDRESCLIFAIQSSTGGRAQTDNRTVGSVAPSHMPDLVDALLPDGCDIAVALENGEEPSVFGQRRVWRFRLPGVDTPDPGAIRDEWKESLARLRAAGVTYLIVPKSAERLVRANTALHGDLEESGRVITRQRSVGVIYDLGAESKGDRKHRANGKSEGRGRDGR